MDNRSLNVLLISAANKVLDSLTKVLKSRNIRSVRVTSDIEVYYALEHTQAFNAIFLDISSFDENVNEIIRQLRIRLANVPIIALYDADSIDKAIDTLKRGVFDSLLIPFATEDVIHTLESVLAHWQSNANLKNNHLHTKAEKNNDHVVAHSRAMQKAMQLATAAAHTNAPVVITGESGSGKEFLASKIHQLSLRRLNPFIKVNCTKRGVIDIEKEIFGQKRSEFPWESHIMSGSLEMANHGTVFFDEISGIPGSVQVKLRDFLQNGEFEVPGTDARITTDIRVIAATSENLEKQVQNNIVRKDFYFKINIISIKVPPLRDRPEDLAELAESFVDFYARESKKFIKGIHHEAMEVLKQYSWPGNVRELQNYLERAVFFCKSDWIMLNDLPEVLLRHTDERFISLRLASPLMDDVEEAVISQVLNETKGNVSKTANLLGISRGTLYSKIRKYGLESETKSKLLKLETFS